MLDHVQGAEAATVARLLLDWIAHHVSESEREDLAASVLRALGATP